MPSILLLTYGTRGDVQPFIALGLGLKASGYTVALAAPGAFADLVETHSLGFVPLPGDPAELSRALVDKAGNNFFATPKLVFDYALPLARGVVERVTEAARGVDAIVHTFLMTTTGHLAARQRDIPDFSAQLFPIFAPTREYPAPLSNAASLPRWLYRPSHLMAESIFRVSNSTGYHMARRLIPELSQQRYTWPFDSKNGPPTPLLLAVSPSVLPRPTDWNAHQHVPGYWFLDGGTQPLPDPVEEFLAAGPPPVFIGYGSVVTREAARLEHITLEAIKLSGQRAILQAGWSGMGKGAASSRDLLIVGAVPHAALFSRVAAVAHHGGAGTTSAGLRAGVPSLITPFSSDQPFWAYRVGMLGVGPKPIPAQKLTAPKLAEAIRQAATDETIRQKAAALGEKIRAEDGVGEAVRIIKGYMGRA